MDTRGLKKRFSRALNITHSYTKASERLHISQPALTKNIKKLESDFGGRLIQRSNKGCSLTKLGEVLYSTCKKYRA